MHVDYQGPNFAALTKNRHARSWHECQGRLKAELYSGIPCYTPLSLGVIWRAAIPLAAKKRGEEKQMLEGD